MVTPYFKNAPHAQFLPGTNSTNPQPISGIIMNLQELQAVNNDLTGSYLIGTNIDASATSNSNGGKGFVPLGTSSTPFTGTLLGGNYTISNLNINRPGSNDVGLFGAIGSTGKVSGIVMTGAHITGANDVGGVVGSNAGTVSNDKVAGSVSGTTNVGGVVGINSGTATSLVNTGATVVGTANVGGVIGSNTGTVTNATASNAASVSGSNIVGGLIGKNTSAATLSGTLSNAGSVSGSSNVGGVIGSNAGSLSGARVLPRFHGRLG